VSQSDESFVRIRKGRKEEMESALQAQVEVEREAVSSKNIPTGQRVDQRIDDVVRMTVATACIVLESEGRDMTIGCANLDMLISKMRTRVLQLLSVKERRNA
jgi:hypothetical protein